MDGMVQTAWMMDTTINILFTWVSAVLLDPAADFALIDDARRHLERRILC